MAMRTSNENWVIAEQLHKQYKIQMTMYTDLQFWSHFAHCKKCYRKPCQCLLLSSCLASSGCVALLAAAPAASTQRPGLCFVHIIGNTMTLPTTLATLQHVNIRNPDPVCNIQGGELTHNPEAPKLASPRLHHPLLQEVLGHKVHRVHVHSPACGKDMRAWLV